jgi:hypothetical protein
MCLCSGVVYSFFKDTFSVKSENDVWIFKSSIFLGELEIQEASSLVVPVRLSYGSISVKIRVFEE